jgi:hypothetical protein
MGKKRKTRNLSIPLLTFSQLSLSDPVVEQEVSALVPATFCCNIYTPILIFP